MSEMGSKELQRRRRGCTKTSFLERQQMSVLGQSFLRDNAIDYGFSKEECDCPGDLCSFLNHKAARLLKRKLGRSSSKDWERKALVQNRAVDGAME